MESLKPKSKRRRLSEPVEPFDMAPMPVEDPEIRGNLQSETSSELHSSCASVLEPPPDKREDDPIFPPKMPVGKNYVDFCDPDLPSTSGNWKKYMRQSNAEKSKSPPSRATECLMSEASSSKVDEENSAGEWPFDWDVSDGTPLRIIDFDDLTTSFANMTIGTGEQEDLDNCIESERLFEEYPKNHGLLKKCRSI
ncbi:uncharacterized protein LOC119557692 [Drosophila subpulchrella]|uniref:uncharacterized protein LOC119557692 n=1 Tax=Drosophila subpulchrella TaxID=1486046 RepID=UPI0018A12A03|nr:uncharacterized protein LOC119557692 [Drosophila subpulchrella]